MENGPGGLKLRSVHGGKTIHCDAVISGDPGIAVNYEVIIVVGQGVENNLRPVSQHVGCVAAARPAIDQKGLYFDRVIPDIHRHRGRLNCLKQVSKLRTVKI